VAGFREALAAYPGIEVVAAPAVERGLRDVAKQKTDNLLTSGRPVQAIFGSNDDCALGALAAVQAAGRTDILIVGYDATPEARSWISLYKNLAHHFVHQRSSGDASSFWAGCGAIRTQCFRDLGGFDESYRRPSIEDVELGYRLRERGHRIRLLPDAQVTHLKEWSLTSWLRADLADRAVPWARLLRQGRSLPRDLNFTTANRAASLLVALGCASLTTALWRPIALVPSAGVLALALALDADLLLLCARRGGILFAFAAAGFQLLHRLAGLLGLVIGLVIPKPRVASATSST